MKIRGRKQSEERKERNFVTDGDGFSMIGELVKGGGHLQEQRDGPWADHGWRGKWVPKKERRQVSGIRRCIYFPVEHVLSQASLPMTARRGQERSRIFLTTPPKLYSIIWYQRHLSS